ncbi:hypothetical protein PSPO01_01623 [Paraphaeosphaeria sporulosa]
MTGKHETSGIAWWNPAARAVDAFALIRSAPACTRAQAKSQMRDEDVIRCVRTREVVKTTRATSHCCGTEFLSSQGIPLGGALALPLPRAAPLPVFCSYASAANQSAHHHKPEMISSQGVCSHEAERRLRRPPHTTMSAT